jgi:hypothetical protein
MLHFLFEGLTTHSGSSHANIKQFGSLHVPKINPKYNGTILSTCMGLLSFLVLAHQTRKLERKVQVVCDNMA